MVTERRCPEFIEGPKFQKQWQPNRNLAVSSTELKTKDYSQKSDDILSLKDSIILTLSKRSESQG